MPKKKKLTIRELRNLKGGRASEVGSLEKGEDEVSTGKEAGMKEEGFKNSPSVAS